MLELKAAGLKQNLALVLLSIYSFGNNEVRAQDRSLNVVAFTIFSRTIYGSEQDARKIMTMIKTGQERYNDNCKDEAKKLKSVNIPTLIPLDDAVTKESILKQIESKKRIIDDRTTVVFYYKGHGGVDDNTGEHLLFLDWFDPANDKESIIWKKYVLERKELLEKLKGTKARLVVLITDTCSFPVPGRPPAFEARGDKPGLFEDLFLLPKDVVNITSSSFTFNPQTKEATGEFSWSRTTGGIFTNAFLNIYQDEGKKKDEAIGKKKDTEKKEPEVWMTWDVFFSKVKERTKADFHQYKRDLLENSRLPRLPPDERRMLRGQIDQTPMAFELPKQQKK